jgi:trimeric autotransporter adhesin
MKRVILIFAIALVCIVANAQIPQGFNYQAIARDGSGNLISGALIKVKLSVLSDTTGFYASGTGTYIWEEEHTNVKTNSLGLFTLVLGDPAFTKTNGSATSFKAINWSATPLFIGIKIANPTNYRNMGSASLWSVPYSLVSGTLSGSQNKLVVKGNVASPDSALFEVKNNTGQTIFAVYNEGVRMYVDDGIAKGSTKGGFAIGGFGTVKALSQEYFRVTRDSTRVYINQAVKGATKGGFAIGGFNVVKGSDNNFLDLTPKNYFIGQGAGKSNTTGSYNTFLGYQNGYSNITGNNNVFLGNQAGYSNTIGYNNVILGTSAGYNNIDGFSNTFIGTSAGFSNTTGFFNIFIGEQAGISNTTASRNVFLGQLAGRYNTTGSGNVFIGQQTGEANTSGSFNLFVGRAAGNFNTLGQGNTFLGINAGNANTIGNDNVNLGGESGKWNGTGSSNVNLGTGAGYGNTNGNNNINIGYYTGVSLNSGSNNIFIGPGAGAGLTNTSNKLLIENSYADTVNALIYGDFSRDYLKLNAAVDIRNRLYITSGNNWDLAGGEGDFRIGNSSYRLKMGVALDGGGAGAAGIMQVGQPGGYNVLSIGAQGNYLLFLNGASQNVGIGTNSPGYKLTVNGTAWCSGGTWTGSDIRWKKNISDFNNTLSGILSLQAVYYDLRTDEFPEMGFVTGSQIGLIAQDVEKIFPLLVNTDKNGYKAVAYDKLGVVMIEGIKDQQKQIELVKLENQRLKSELNELRTLVNRLITNQTNLENK